MVVPIRQDMKPPAKDGHCWGRQGWASALSAHGTGFDSRRLHFIVRFAGPPSRGFLSPILPRIPPDAPQRPV